ncbi:MAG: SUMF1/EgtB/PvdO family nonheme iron enzyme [Deltaproteobacteria bacterium]|nr:MAG: SUMF1/EgtB/PvdO family nonheme iron enzyme [Deltaproteobacteria bacterium]
MENHWDISMELGSGPLPESVVCPLDGAEMVLVPKGPFTMGITEEELRQIFILDQRQNPVFATEIPARPVHLEAYYIDRYPVTNYQYRKFVEETKHRDPWLWNHPSWGQSMQPVVFVGWEDARAYANWAGKSLPSEAQWEKAGRGTDGRMWAWGQEFLLGRCNSREYGLERTSEIDLFDEGMSPYGCYDMCGNVWEMCEGEWQGEHLPMRGGCFLGSATFVRVTCRWTPEDPVNGAHWLGFRCVKEIPT